MNFSGIRGWRWYRQIILITVDLTCVAFSLMGAFWLRLDQFIPPQYAPLFSTWLAILLLVSMPIFHLSGLYHQIWRFANASSAIHIARAVIFSALMFAAITFFAYNSPRIPRSIYILYSLICLFLITSTRFAWRLWISYTSETQRRQKQRCLIYGAGREGDSLVQIVHSNVSFPYEIIGFIDEDQNRIGGVIRGIRILGNGSKLEAICSKNDVAAVVLAIPNFPGEKVRHLMNECQKIGVKLLIMPNLADPKSMMDGLRPREVDITDLLRRPQRQPAKENVYQFLHGKVVLVTGAGGSIGSEICRQVYQCEPAALIMLDSSEFNLYEIDSQLRELHKPTVFYSILGSTTDKALLKRLFSKYQPAFILHAAAYKHVSIVENNPLTGIINNIEGTKCLVEVALEFGSEHFTLISSDKAVRPTSMMGATKRCCELYIDAIQHLYPKQMALCAVRFGNVLGSSGSVVPKFLRQIREGGPVTVTDPRATRFFMLISEAVGLVLQSAAMAKGGEIYVLNMGEPVNIYDMAKKLIFLAGKELDQDIKIEFTGLQAGEKLHEELILEGCEEHFLHEDIMIAKANELSAPWVVNQIDQILDSAHRGLTDAASEGVKALLEEGMRQQKSDGTDQPLQQVTTPLH